MRKIVIMALASAMALSMAGCGSGKPAKTGNEPTPKPPMEGAMVIPENWDGVTFKSTDGKITIVAPEKGWTCTNDTESSVMLSKDEDTFSCVIAKGDNGSVLKKDEQEIKQSVSKHNELLEFNYNKDQDGKITYDYAVKLNEKTGIDAVKYSSNTIVGDVKTEISVSTKTGNDARFNELKKLIGTNVEVKD